MSPVAPASTPKMTSSTAEPVIDAWVVEWFLTAVVSVAVAFLMTLGARIWKIELAKENPMKIRKPLRCPRKMGSPRRSQDFVVSGSRWPRGRPYREATPIGKNEVSRRGGAAVVLLIARLETRGGTASSKNIGAVFAPILRRLHRPVVRRRGASEGLVMVRRDVRQRQGHGGLAPAGATSPPLAPRRAHHEPRLPPTRRRAVTVHRLRGAPGRTADRHSGGQAPCQRRRGRQRPP